MNNNTNANQVPGTSEEEDGETIVMEGFRQSRDRTNWMYRGSAMTTTDRMDMEALQHHAVDLEAVVGHLSTTCAALIQMAQIKAREGARSAFLRLRNVIQFISLSIQWIICSIELVYLDIEDRIYYVHQRRQFNQHQNRRIDGLADNNSSEELFGFKIHELELLLTHWRIPQRMRMANHVFSGEEAMLIFLCYIRTATPFTRLAQTTFGGDPRKYTYHVRSISDHLYSHFYHKISGDSMQQWVPFVADFRRAIWDKLLSGLVNEQHADGSEIDYEVYIPFNTFRIFGWLDDTDMQTNRPRPARTMDGDNEVIDLHDTQQAFYK